ncbi:MAG TPA: hypothetical protein VKY31_15985 [Terriglobia bacterium]|nr:hypothetical protein [Terriglobia bacterium]
MKSYFSLERQLLCAKIFAVSAAGLLFVALAGTAIVTGSKAQMVLDRSSAAITTADATIKALPAMVADEAIGIRAELGARVDTALDIARDEIRQTRNAAVQQIAITRADALEEIEGLHQDGIAISVAGLRMADRQLDSMKNQIAPTLGAVETTLDGIDQMRAELRPQVLGLVAASKVTMGETAQTLRTVRDAAPRFVNSEEKIAGNIERITDDAAKLADRLTRPKSKKEQLIEWIVPAALVAARFM